MLLVAGHVAGQSSAIPTAPPVATDGLSVYGDRCANCHGQRGLGDGELAPDLPNPPAAFASPEYLRAAVPSQMFDVITNGNTSQGMPPFGPDSSNPLADDQRWNAIAAIYSLGTPIESVDKGRQLYQDNCLACHGEGGLGDGPDAVADPGDLTSQAYWSAVSNQAVFDALSGSQIAAHESLASAGLSEEDLWSVVDYARTFSYEYTDALARFRPLDSAAVTGAVLNGATGEPPDEGTTAVLRAYTQDLDVTLTMSTTLDAEGAYRFDLTDVPQEWFYRVAVNYDGVDFGSDFAQLTSDAAEADLPVTVFNATNDPSGLSIQQLHFILGFGDGFVQVNELYQVNNDSVKVFVGESGDPRQGTFQFDLPDGAEQISFQRGFSTLDSFIPANEVTVTGSGYADTLPVRPGQSSLVMLVSFDLPYDNGVSFSQLVDYDTSMVNLVLQNVGVDLADTTSWQVGGQTTIGDTTVNTYSQTDVPAGTELILVLEGKPQAVAATATSAGLIRNNTSELLIGAGAALLVIGLAAVVIRRWQTRDVQEVDQEELLQELADLDDDFEAGEIDERQYHRERAALKAELAAIWEGEEEE